MKEILQNKVNELQDEHNRVCNAIAQLRQNLEKLNVRRIELEGAMKEMLEILNMNQEVVDKNDTEGETSQRTDSNKG